MHRLKIVILLFLVFPHISVGQNNTIANIQLENLDSQKTSLKNYYKHGPLLIDFWAMWCIPCRSELKVFQALYEELKDKGITIAAINIDNQKSIAKVKSFISSQNFSFPNFIDPNSEIFRLFNGQNIPYSLIIDTLGNVIKRRTGYEPGDELVIKEDLIKLARKR